MKNTTELEHFLKTGYKELLVKLSKDTVPAWGVMDAQQMIEHLALALKVSNGLLDLPLSSEESRAEKLKRISLMSERPLPQGFQNPLLPLTPLPYETEDLDQAYAFLDHQLSLFFEHFSSMPEGYTRMHNMFGLLNYEEWLWFHYKHFQHHFTQFGLV